ncbi:MAG: OmpA family protein [Rikenellaceae bacterium]|nr:OmpA family protein [Rikenellaceae bacterium]
MKNLRMATVAVCCAAGLMMAGCGTMNKTQKGALYGGGGGTLLGAGIGALAGGGKGAAIGAAVGAGVGAGAGALIGRKMDKQRAELEKIEEVKVEEVTDVNNLKAIKVTFDNGILFPTGKSELSAASRDALGKFAESVVNNPSTDISVYGHTDNTGSREVNERLSAERARAVANFLIGRGVDDARIKTRGLAYDSPVADNDTEAGRALNRRVEVFITASPEMVKQAEAGTLQ